MHAYHEAEGVAGSGQLSIVDVTREQKQPKPKPRKAGEQEAGGSTAGSSNRQPPKLDWYATLSFGQDHGFQPGQLPTVQFAQPASTGGQLQWGAPVTVHSVPDKRSLMLQGKLDGKGKMGKVEAGMLARCARRFCWGLSGCLTVRSAWQLMHWAGQACCAGSLQGCCFCSAASSPQRIPALCPLPLVRSETCLPPALPPPAPLFAGSAPGRRREAQ